MALAIGIDCGTTGIRTVIYDENGNLRGAGICPLVTHRTSRGWSEQEPSDWWNGLLNSMKIALKELPPDAMNEIKAIGVTATGPSLVFADRSGRSVRPSMMWDDIRAIECVEYLNFSHESLVGKALWARLYAQEDFLKTDVLCDATEWLIWKLTGELAMNKLSNFPIADHLQKVDASSREAIRSKFPDREIEVGGIVGHLLPSLAEELQLPAGLPVINATRDAQVAGMSLGLEDRRSIGCVGGSSNLVLAMTDEPIAGLESANQYPAGILHPQYSLISGAHYAGIIWDWWKRIRGDDTVRDDLVQAEALPAGSDGIVFMEWFQGNRMPWRDPYLTGGIWGLSLFHQPAHIARSILEGIAFGTRLIAEEISSHAALHDRDFRVTGGLSRIPLYTEILASVLNRPLTVVQVVSGSAVGAVTLAAQAVGMNIEMTHQTITVEPNEESAKVYDEYFAYYKDTAAQLKPLMHRLNHNLLSGRNSK